MAYNEPQTDAIWAKRLMDVTGYDIISVVKLSKQSSANLLSIAHKFKPSLAERLSGALRRLRQMVSASRAVIIGHRYSTAYGTKSNDTMYDRLSRQCPALPKLCLGLPTPAYMLGIRVNRSSGAGTIWQLLGTGTAQRLDQFDCRNHCEQVGDSSRVSVKYAPSCSPLHSRVLQVQMPRSTQR